MGIVVNLVIRHHTGQLGGHFGDFQPGDKAGQVMGVRPQVTDYAGFSGNAGVVRQTACLCYKRDNCDNCDKRYN